MAKPLRALATDTTGELNVLRHDCDALAVDCAQIGVLEEALKIRLRGFLERDDRRRLETKVRLKILCNLADKALKGQLADQELRRFLVPADFAECDGTRAVAIGLLHTARHRSRLPRKLRRQVLAGCLAPRALTSSLLRAGHVFLVAARR